VRRLPIRGSRTFVDRQLPAKEGVAPGNVLSVWKRGNRVPDDPTASGGLVVATAGLMRVQRHHEKLVPCGKQNQRERGQDSPEKGHQRSCALMVEADSTQALCEEGQWVKIHALATDPAAEQGGVGFKVLVGRA
jgi:hypothetical protein